MFFSISVGDYYLALNGQDNVIKCDGPVPMSPESVAKIIAKFTMSERYARRPEPTFTIVSYRY